MSAPRAIEFENAAGGSDGISAQQSSFASTADLGEAIAQESQSLQVQRRTEVAQQPFIRGFKNGQIYTQLDGSYYVPARQDLDSVLSKIDPGTIQDVIVINGPYSVRYGPGFTFLDIVTVPTPRNQGARFTTNANYTHNGRQWYGRDTVAGGGEDFGYRMSYGNRTGSDYISGDGTRIPSSYQNQDVYADLSYDINPDQRLDFTYRRLDQSETEYPAQFFDINFLGSEGYNLRITDEDETAPWDKLSIVGWYNRTRFYGDTLNTSKRRPIFDVITRVEDALARNLGVSFGSVNFSGFTNGDVTSTGASSGVTFGDQRDANLTLGADVRYLNQQIVEKFGISNVPTPLEIETNLPRSEMIDPGAFFELSLPTSSYLTTRIGGRVDWVHTTANIDDLGPSISLPGLLTASRDERDRIVDQNDVLLAGYITQSMDLTQEWTANMNLGYAERPPTALERYSDALFLAVTQNSFSRVIGDPNLDKERNWQIDLGLQADYQDWRGYVRGYNAWIYDYITFAAAAVPDPSGARLLQTINTRYATISGVEVSSYNDLNAWMTPFAEVSYVYGFDQALDRPLPTIPPLQTRVGLQLHDDQRGRIWNLETFARVVNGQDMVGVLREFPGTTGRLQFVEEATPGFTTVHIRGLWNANQNLQFVSGIDNLFDNNYLEHLSLRLPADANAPVNVPGAGRRTEVLSPGFTSYFGVNWVY